MRSYATSLVSFLLFCSSLHADNLEKTQKKELESQVKAITAEAETLEKSGHLAEARARVRGIASTHRDERRHRGAQAPR